MDQIEQIIDTLTREYRSLIRVKLDRMKRLNFDDRNVLDSVARTNELLWVIGVVLNARDGIPTFAGDAVHIWAGRTYVDSIEDGETNQA